MENYKDKNVGRHYVIRSYDNGYKSPMAENLESYLCFLQSIEDIIQDESIRENFRGISVIVHLNHGLRLCRKRENDVDTIHVSAGFLDTCWCYSRIHLVFHSQFFDKAFKKPVQKIPDCIDYYIQRMHWLVDFENNPSQDLWNKLNSWPNNIPPPPPIKKDCSKCDRFIASQLMIYSLLFMLVHETIHACRNHGESEIFLEKEADNEAVDALYSTKKEDASWNVSIAQAIIISFGVPLFKALKMECAVGDKHPSPIARMDNIIAKHSTGPVLSPDSSQYNPEQDMINRNPILGEAHVMLTYLAQIWPEGEKGAMINHKIKELNKSRRFLDLHDSYFAMANIYAEYLSASAKK